MEQEENATTSVQEFSEGLTTFFEAMSTYMTQVAQQVLPSIKNMYDMIYAEYQKYGAPYGDLPEGCMRWLTERHEAQRLIDEAQSIVDHHEGLAYLRKKIAERRELSHDEIEQEHQVE